MVIKMTLQHLFPKKRSVIDSSGHCQVQIKVITAAPSLSYFFASVLVPFLPCSAVGTSVGLVRSA